MDATLLPTTLAIFKILEHAKLDYLEAKGRHLADIFVRNAALKEAYSSQNFFMVQRNIGPNDNLKLGRETQQLASQKEKQDWKLNKCWQKEKALVWTK